MDKKSHMGFCFKCGYESQDYSVVETSIIKVVKDISVTYIGKIPYCKKCSSEIYVPALSEENTDKLMSEYEKNKSDHEINKIKA